jgi:hypothetical protein
MKLKCRNCTCTYFEKVLINEFYDYEGNLYSNLAEHNPATDVKAYRCVKCQSLNMPPLSYSTPDADRKLAAKLTSLSDGGEVEPDNQVLRSRRMAEGYVGAVPLDDDTRKDPSKQGTFVQR